LPVLLKEIPFLKKYLTNFVFFLFKFFLLDTVTDITKNYISSSKRKSGPITGLQWSKGFQEVKVLDYMTMAHDGGKVVILTDCPLLPPGNTTGTHFC